MLKIRHLLIGLLAACSFTVYAAQSGCTCMTKDSLIFFANLTLDSFVVNGNNVYASLNPKNTYNPGQCLPFETAQKNSLITAGQRVVFCLKNQARVQLLRQLPNNPGSVTIKARNGKGYGVVCKISKPCQTQSANLKIFDGG